MYEDYKKEEEKWGLQIRENILTRQKQEYKEYKARIIEKEDYKDYKGKRFFLTLENRKYEN